MKGMLELYRIQAMTRMMEKFGYRTVMQVPRIVKVTLNMGVGREAAGKKSMDVAVGELTQIAGQKAVVARARKSVSNFKVRKGFAIGCKVTLRQRRMYDFLDRLVSIALPRIRDFRGLSRRSFDGNGNFNLGVREQIIFPEIDYDKIEGIRGLDIAITTSAKTDEEAYALLEAMNFPLGR